MLKFVDLELFNVFGFIADNQCFVIVKNLKSNRIKYIRIEKETTLGSNYITITKV